MDEILHIEGGHGFGLLSRAQGYDRGSTAVVLLNAGLLHRVGPFRMSVQLARMLAGRGIDVFRFDLPRIGDGATNSTADNAAIIAAVFDTITHAAGAKTFAIGGICNAADIAWHVAQHDSRIAGVWLFDGFAHRGNWFRAGRVRQALARPLPQWPGLALKLAARVRASSDTVDTGQFRDWPEPAEFREQAAVMLARGVRILAMYTGGISKYLLHPRQLDDTFGASRKDAGLEVEFWPELDHTLLSPADRDRVMARVEAWCAKI